MDNILLRKKTKAAKIGFGKYTELTVENVMSNDPDYIAWMYFCNEHITFTDDVLNEMGITKEYRIAKPGVDRRMKHKYDFDRRQKWIDEGENEEQQKIRTFVVANQVKTKYRIIYRKALRTGEYRDSKQQSKGRLAWKNQGH